MENYIGTYEMRDDPELDATMIVSKEVNHAEAGEIPLRKRRIFEFDRRDDEYIYLNLVNVDITSDESILEYCNRYGLPYSSQVCYDSEAGLDQDVEDMVARRISSRISAPYSRNDTIDRLEFCRLAVQVRSLVELKTILDQKEIVKSDCSKLIQLLIYLVFYSREFIYKYNDTDPLPHTRIMNLQYSFHFFRRVSPFIRQLSPANQIAAFLLRYREIIKFRFDLADAMLLSDLDSADNLKLLQFFGEVFDRIESKKPKDEALTMFLPKTEKVLYTATPQIKKQWEVQNAKNQFTVDIYGQVCFSKPVIYDGKVEELRQIGLSVLRDAVNEGLTQVTPLLALEGTTLCGEWQLRHQMEGIYMELFLEFSANSQYRLCANPTCGMYFSVSRNRPNKKFCCHECAALQSKRNQRARQRLNGSKEKSGKKA